MKPLSEVVPRLLGDSDPGPNSVQSDNEISFIVISQVGT